MKTLFPLTLLIAALILSACSPAATPISAPAETQAYPAPVQTEAPSVPESYPAPAQTEAPSMPEAYPAPTQGMGMSTSARVYHIVPGESTVAYEVGETFINRNNKFNVAVGTTGQINGDITVVMDNPAQSTVGTITVDISQFKSDSSKRDSVIQDRFLESSKYPLATFTPTEIRGLPETYTPGETLTFEILGDLTVHQTTQPVTFQVEATLQDDMLSGTAQTTILMSDFGVGPISIAGILNTEDEVNLTFNFVARP